MNTNGRQALITGGSRGLGLGLAEALLARGSAVTVVARGSASLADAKAHLPLLQTAEADVTEPDVLPRLIARVRPTLLVLNAGARPPMGPIDRMTWEDFTANWNQDVRGALYGVQAALSEPLPRGSLVLLVSSGAAEQGSPLSGGYAGAKRALWFLADYAEKLARVRDLGVAFKVVVPQQLVRGTGVGDTGLEAYAAAAGTSTEQVAARWPAMPPRQFGELLAGAVESEGLAGGQVFGVRGDTGVTVIA